MRLDVSPRAEADLDAIAAWISKGSPRAAVRMLDRLTVAFEQIAEWPLASPQIRSRRRGVRARVETPYIIYFRVSEDAVTIDRVLHQRQRRPRLP